MAKSVLMFQSLLEKEKEQFVSFLYAPAYQISLLLYG